MPSSTEYTHKEIDWFKKFILANLCLSISDGPSCIKLSDIIYDKMQVRISYNTLRRVFCIVKTGNRASLYTLDTLSKLIGFSGFNAFVKHINEYEYDILNETILLGTSNKKINHSFILAGLSNIKTPNWEQVYQIKNIIQLCIDLDDYLLLDKVLQFPFDTNNFLENRELYYLAFQPLYLEAEKNNKKIITYIKQHVKTSILIQFVFLQTYVNEDKLNSFWGEWLLNATENLVPDMPMFRSIMLCHKDFINKKIKEASFLLEKTKQLVAGAKFNIHPILLGRIAAWDVILNNNKSYAISIFKTLKLDVDKVLFCNFFYRLVWTFQTKKKTINLIENIDIHRLPTILNTMDKRNFTKFYIILVNYYLLAGKQKETNYIKLRIDKERIDRIETDWFFRTYEKIMR